MASTNNNNQSERTLYYDYLRLLATFAVMLAHVASSKLLNIDVNRSDWGVLNFYDSICRWSVPAFVMISGALLLGRDIELSKIYKKYIPRMVVAFIVWSVLYYIFAEANIWGQITGLFGAGKFDRLITILTGHYHMWYIPMLVGIYICIPIIRQIIMNEKIGRYFLLVAFVFWSVIPFFVRLIRDFAPEKVKTIVYTINGNVEAMEIGLVMGYTFYFILGYYLSRTDFTRLQRIIVYIAGLGGFAFTAFANRILALRAQMPITDYYKDSYINVMLPAVALFVLFKNIPFKKTKLIGILSKASFGAYLSHAMAIELLDYWVGLNTLSFNPWIAAPVTAVVVFICAFTVSIIIGKIPIVKDYVV